MSSNLFSSSVDSIVSALIYGHLRSTPPPSELEEGLTAVLSNLKTQMQPEKKDPVDYFGSFIAESLRSLPSDGCEISQGTESRKWETKSGAWPSDSSCRCFSTRTKYIVRENVTGKHFLIFGLLAKLLENGLVILHFNATVGWSPMRFCPWEFLHCT